ncbi:nucleotide pyrophosphohydrolase [Aeromonas piscicola]|uniref:nucleotide pyrophosphohydrolase n=1 Tax=Aeromonas piscicola TaxID=600645 RepID=UPI0005B3989F|nr:nucleotide pyrophosphohydrolase [Aeromonas piscicola]
MSKTNNQSEQSHEFLKEQLRQFATKRDWNKFHNAKNLSMALSVEASELVEVFQWLTEKESENLSEKQHIKVEEELADIFLYLLRISDVVNVDLFDAANKKLLLNEEKYPIQVSFGNAIKYSDR